MTLYDQEFRSDSNYQPLGGQTFVSAIESTLKGWVSEIKKTRNRWKQHRIDRQAFSHLLSLDKHTLDDIGVSREDILWADRLPMNVNASLELEKIARENKTFSK